MRTLSRSMVLALSASFLALPLLTTSTPAASSAAADPKPGIGQEWPLCGQDGDSDGFYCVESVTRNGSRSSRSPT